MMTKKISILAVAAILVVALSAAPAMAGVGGCRTGVGGCRPGGDNWLEASAPDMTLDNDLSYKSSWLDAFAYILPSDLVTVAKGLLKKDKGDSGDIAIEGVGGCYSSFRGVGGCFL